MSANPTLCFGVAVGTVDTVGLVPINVSNISASLNVMTPIANSASTEAALIVSQAVTQSGSLVSAQNTLTTLTGLLVVGNTITATMTNDIAAINTLVTAVVNANTTIQAQGTLVVNNVGSIQTDLANTTSITTSSNMICQVDTTVVTGCAVLNGCLLGIVTFASANSTLPP